jgi:uncharacterized membrane protein YfcA
VYDNNSDKMS